MRDKSVEIYKVLDQLIRSGKLNEARAKLLKLKRAQISASYLGKIASLARKADLPQLSLILLRATVHPNNGKYSLASDEEKSEYAAALADLGAGIEALKLLTEVNTSNYPQALLHSAFAHFSQWNYAAAVPILREYLKHPGLTPKQQLIGKINLAGAVVHEKLPEADSLLETLRAECLKADHQLAYGYSNLLSAEYTIFKKEFDLAASYLETASSVYQQTEAIEGLFIRKWQAVLELHKRGRKDEAESILAPIRKEAIEKKNWETLRDCDFQEAVFCRNEKLFLKVYFGTHFTAKKQRLLNEYPAAVTIPESYNWTLCGRGHEAKWSIDILSNKQNSLAQGQSAYRLFYSLSSDFYRPMRIAELHGYAYPNEYFNPLSSPGKVHQGICRLRKWLKSRSHFLDILEEGGSYRLSTNNPNLAVTVPLTAMAETRVDGAVQKLEKHFETRGFTTREAHEVLGGSYWHVNRLIKQAENDGLVLKLARGKKTRYAFPEQKSKARAR